MSGEAFDANILIDVLLGRPPALAELKRAAGAGRPWISRMVWIEVMSKGEPDVLPATQAFLDRFGIDEIDVDVARRAATLRRERPRLRTPDAIILASAQKHGRILVTGNSKDFPAGTPGVRIPYRLD